MAPSALLGDSSGVAATVSVPGGNKVKMKDGEATFKNVRIEADAPGSYMLRAKSASRKVKSTYKSPSSQFSSHCRSHDASYKIRT